MVLISADFWAFSDSPGASECWAALLFAVFLAAAGSAEIESVASGFKVEASAGDEAEAAVLQPGTCTGICAVGLLGFGSGS